MEDRITQFAYDQMVERALRGVMREALSVTQRQGLPGQHHFYITFRTDHPGVGLAPRLKSQHPEAMTIVLQNQFWDLDVGDAGFEVSLSFGGRRERLVIPFEAVTAFADPHATFGLQFHVPLGEDDATAFDDDHDDHEDDEDDGPASASGLSPADGVDASPPASPPEGDPNNVITLDRFRKKP